MHLPSDILATRLKNELQSIAGYARIVPNLSNPKRLVFPLCVEVVLNQIPAYYVKDGKRSVRYSHRFRVLIGKEYPYKKPVVRWLTPIFHPNIMMPEDGGQVCTKLLEGWEFNSSLMYFIKGVETLITNPNPSSPFGTDSCTSAAECFNKSSKTLPPIVHVPPPRVVGHD